MIEEVKEAVAFFQEVDGKLSALANEIIEAKGIEAEDMEQARRAGFGDPLPGLSG